MKKSTFICNLHWLPLTRLSLYPSVLDVWKIKLDELLFLVYFKPDFYCLCSVQNLVWNRLKIKLVQLDFWKKFQTRFFKNQVQMDRVFVVLQPNFCCTLGQHLAGKRTLWPTTVQQDSSDLSAEIKRGLSLNIFINSNFHSLKARICVAECTKAPF